MAEVEGLVLRNTGSSYVVVSDDGVQYECKVKGNFRLKGIRTTNPVAIGDRVVVQTQPTPPSYITGIKPRRNYIIRRASNLSKESHIIASNLDCAMLVVSLVDPATPLTFIDRFLATAAAYDVPCKIVLNKVDLLDDVDPEVKNDFRRLYKSADVPVLFTSAKNGSGIAELREAIKDKITLFSGNSGVGKSSLINCLLPDANLRTAQVSESHRTGMHTTTFSQMLPLPEGGYLIDTPGVKGFGTIDFQPNEVGHYFHEIFRESRNCRYGNCTHTNEPGCAVLNAVEDERIALSRYNSYLSILNDINQDKYRKPF